MFEVRNEIEILIYSILLLVAIGVYTWSLFYDQRNPDDENHDNYRERILDRYRRK